MTSVARTLASAFCLLAACGESHSPGEDGDCEYSPALALAVCEAVPERTGEAPGPASLVSGDARVAAIDSIDGETHLSLEQDGSRRVVVLPAAPLLAEGDTVAIDAQGTALTISHEGAFVAFAGGLLESGSITTSLLRAMELGSAPVALGDVTAMVEALCAGSAPHRDPRFCPDVGLVSYGLRFDRTTVVAPGESAIVSVGERRVAVTITSITRRDDSYSDACTASCADYWLPSFDVAIVPLSAP